MTEAIQAEGLVKRFGATTALGGVDLAGFGGDDRQARINWLAKLLDLHELIVAGMPPGDEAPPPPELALAPDQMDACLLDRLIAWGNEQRRRGADPDQILAVLDQAVLLAERVGGQRCADLLPSLYSDRAAQLEAIGDLAGAAGSMRLAAWHAAEPAYQAALDDLADQLEAQTRGA